VDDEPKDDAGNAPVDENAQLVAPGRAPRKDATSQKPEDHRRSDGTKFSVR
jgi:hypothetical protein